MESVPYDPNYDPAFAGGLLMPPFQPLMPPFAPIFPVFVPKDAPSRTRASERAGKTRTGRDKANVHTPAVKNKKAAKRVPGPEPKGRRGAQGEKENSEPSKQTGEQELPSEDPPPEELPDIGETPAKLDAAKRQRPPDDPEEQMRKKKAAKVEFIERHLTREPRAEPLAGTDDEWERRSEKRKRQVDLGKGTLGYRNYVAAVPRDQRDESQPPTPDHTTRDLSRKDFEAHLLVWRTFLHKYDDVTPPLGDESAAEEDVAMTDEWRSGFYD